MKKNKLWLILIPVVLVILIGGGVTAWALLRGGSSNEYAELMSEARSYAAAGNFDSAVEKYEAAIQVEPNEPEAFEALIKLYITLDQPEQAQDVLARYDTLNAGSNTLDTLYESQLDELVAEVAAEQTTEASAAEEAKVETLENTIPTLNEEILRFISGATFKDYEKTYGSGEVVVGSASTEVTYSFMTCSYTDDADGLYSNGKPREEARPVSVTFLDISAMFSGFSGSASVADMEQSFGVTIEELDGVASFSYNGCEVEFAVEDGMLTSNDAWNVIEVAQGTEEADTCTLSGDVTDATTGQSVNGYNIGFRSGSDNKSGGYVEKIDGVSGSYSVDLEPNDYTVEISCAGYITEYFNITVHGWFTSDSIDFVISPELEAGEIRIVLTWNATPLDLDSHLLGTNSSGRNVHVWFSNQSADGANLDVDDVDGYGPETTTITDTAGSYTFVVHDYRETGTMAAMGATVKIYTSGSSQPITVTVPGGVINDWEVCKIENGEVTVTNGAYSGSL